MNKGGRKQQLFSSPIPLIPLINFYYATANRLIQEISTRENDENANRNIANMEKIYGKEIEKPVMISHVVALCSGGVGVDATALSLQKSMYSITSLLTAQLLSNYNTLDLLGDPILWTPFLPPESSYNFRTIASLSS